MESHLK
jgi:hypothetical protein